MGPLVFPVQYISLRDIEYTLNHHTEEGFKSDPLGQPPPVDPILAVTYLRDLHIFPETTILRAIIPGEKGLYRYRCVGEVIPAMA